MAITKGLIMTGSGVFGILFAFVWLSIAMKTHEKNKNNGFVKEHPHSVVIKATVATEEAETADMKTLLVQNPRVTEGSTELLTDITETAAIQENHSDSTELLIEKNDNSQLEAFIDSTEQLIEDIDETELLKC